MHALLSAIGSWRTRMRAEAGEMPSWTYRPNAAQREWYDVLSWPWGMDGR
jgi:hypothetical protein